MCSRENYIGIDGLVASGDLRSFTAAADLAAALQADTDLQGLPAMTERRSQELWHLRDLQPGDKLVVTKGSSTILGIGEVQAPGYQWSNAHTVSVRWTSLQPRRDTRHPDWTSKLVETLTEAEFNRLAGLAALEPQPRLNLKEVSTQFSAALRASGIRFGDRHDDLVRSFVASLATKRLVILAGLSGSGKTQIALRFGDWLGEQRRLVVPVRPDWTGPEPLLGYENVLKSPPDEHKTLRPWHVPQVLEFALKASADPEHPYLLILDEMNLAHVERYFADFLSGMESGENCIPNAVQAEDGTWLVDPKAQSIPVPENLFVVGTVNVDETTYMFSPKVLDRANTFEFRVGTDDLAGDYLKPAPVEAGDPALVRGFLAIATDETWQRVYRAPQEAEFTLRLLKLHALLADGDLEFGHRVFYEAVRYCAMLAAAGDDDSLHALDQQIYQKVLPRLHGSRRRLEPTLRALAQFCYTLHTSTDRFEPGDHDPKAAKLPLSYAKLKRMFRNLIVNQFVSFTE